ncbi:Ribonuclease H-like superfamily [Arabidopsis thaliana x Arabidopsis arenosa]|uniref:Ribonuclease H-like superfamily n=1 Tax=Arabidopsis thaliana x Arabidopsis arenosa TaxID=1240361 RepID=A0A8T1Z0K0_9BRAS|nr:Ribonuclease H-like superfamily [Arabidopsis thaliana x Arabidopsis arenosa]
MRSAERSLSKAQEVQANIDLLEEIIRREISDLQAEKERLTNQELPKRKAKLEKKAVSDFSISKLALPQAKDTEELMDEAQEKEQARKEDLGPRSESLSFLKRLLSSANLRPMGGGTTAEDRSKIALFKVKKKFPFQGENSILEFTSILVKTSHFLLLISLILCGRIWAGHNVLKFDCPRIREAFVEIGRNPPEPRGIIDSLALLTQRFGVRADDMELAEWAAYFGLCNQTHSSLDDIRMNFEVLKCCATVLFLKSNLPDKLIEYSEDCTNINKSSADWKTGENSNAEAQTNQFDMSTLRKEIPTDIVASEGTGDQERFLDLDEISIPSITATHVGSQRKKIQLFLGDKPLRLHCPELEVHFGINFKFQDTAGRPKLNFVVNLYPSLCNVLQECDSAAHATSIDSGSISEWNPVIIPIRISSYPTARIHIPAKSSGTGDRYAAEIHKRETSGVTILRNPKAEELKDMVKLETVLDAFLSLEPYDYMERAGIRLVAKKLVIH